MCDECWRAEAAGLECAHEAGEALGIDGYEGEHGRRAAVTLTCLEGLQFDVEGALRNYSLKAGEGEVAAGLWCAGGSCRTSCR